MLENKQIISLNSLKCDWYNTTFNNLRGGHNVDLIMIEKLRHIFENLIFPNEVVFVCSDKGWRGYPLSGQFLKMDSDGEANEVIALVGYGSDRDDMGLFCSVSGSYSHEYREAVLLEADNNPMFYHAVSRCDVAFDWIDLDSTDLVFQRFQDIAKRKKLNTHYEGDWDYGRGGRTYYIGSPASDVRIVLYEKGKEQIKKGFIDSSPEVLNWLRLEVRVKGGRGRKNKIPNMELNDIFFATRTVQSLIKEALPDFDFSNLVSDNLVVTRKDLNKTTQSTFAYILKNYRRALRETFINDYNSDKILFINRILRSIDLEHLVDEGD